MFSFFGIAWIFIGVVGFCIFVSIIASIIKSTINTDLSIPPISSNMQQIEEVEINELPVQDKVCSYCGGNLEVNDKNCPSCGAGMNNKK